jgi:hypothetical protein
MIKILLACLLVSSVLTTPKPVPITDCDNIGDKYFAITEIDLDPPAVPAGTDLAVTATGVAHQDMVVTKYSVTVYLAGFPAFT